MTGVDGQAGGTVGLCGGDVVGEAYGAALVDDLHHAGVLRMKPNRSGWLAINIHGGK